MTSRPMSRRLLFPASGLIALCAFVHACGGGGGGGGGGSTPPPPNPNPGPSTFVATSVFPSNSATGVSRVPTILLGFNDIVNPATMSATTVQLLEGAAPVGTTLTYLSCNNRVQIVPNAALNPATPYTVSLTSGLLDDDGEGLVAVTFSFTTSGSGDIMRPPEPTGLTGMPNGGNETTEVALDWDDVTDDVSGPTAVFYRVYVSPQQSLCFDFSAPDFITGQGDSQAVVPGLDPMTAYTFVVRAVDEGGNESLSSAELNVTTATSFLANVVPVVNNFCQSCHNPGGTATQAPYFINMDYTTSQTIYNSWVGANSQCATAGASGFGTRVVGGNAAASFLWNKISGLPAGVVCGSQMPFGQAPLSAANQQIIFTWIEEGAMDN